MKNFAVISLALLFTVTLGAQDFQVFPWEASPLGAVTSPSDERMDLFPVLTYMEAPDGQSKNKHYLSAIKEEVVRKFPRKEVSPSNQLRGAGEPQVISSFPGITGVLGIPLDNHLAVSNSGTVISVANLHITSYEEGETAPSFAQSLVAFTRPLNLPNTRFDPRVMYDEKEDRFIVVMLQGTTTDNTYIVVAFSQTNDPKGDWNLYTIEGNPFNLNIFSDYPMLALTETDLIITINAVDVDSTWQDGFVETYIWQCSKHDGYNGDSLTKKLWKDVQFGGKNIRNLCPVTPGTERLDDFVYFLSDRNFAIQNDTFFLVKLTGGIDDPGATIEVDYLITDVAYGVPPNAKQPSLLLQTNDARVLDGFLENDQIQFVANTVDTATGRAVIYHGIIDDVENATTVKGKIITYDDHELGYPDISYAGTNPDEDHALIVASHVSETRFPGHSVLEFDGAEYSPWVTLAEGEASIRRIGGDVQRWGDYSGNARRYNQPGVSWMVSSYGRGSNEYGLWISEIGRSDINVSVKNILNEANAKVFPNPFQDYIRIQFDMPEAKMVTFELFNDQGQLIYRFFETKPKKTGLSEFAFSPQDLTPGNYILSITADTGAQINKKIQYVR